MAAVVAISSAISRCALWITVGVLWDAWIEVRAASEAALEAAASEVAATATAPVALELKGALQAARAENRPSGEMMSGGAKREVLSGGATLAAGGRQKREQAVLEAATAVLAEVRFAATLAATVVAAAMLGAGVTA